LFKYKRGGENHLFVLKFYFVGANLSFGFAQDCELVEPCVRPPVVNNVGQDHQGLETLAWRNCFQKNKQT
jgi:hypothetical protein